MRGSRAGLLTALVAASVLALPSAAAGQGIQYMRYVGASADGEHVFIDTLEQLVPGDTDDKLDVYDRSAGATTLVTPGTTTSLFTGMFVRAAEDGERVLIRSTEPLEAADTDAAVDIYERSGGATTLISAGEINGNGAFPVFPAGASADLSHVFFYTDEQLVATDTDSSTDLYERSGGATTLVSAGEVNGDGAFPVSFFGFSTDGERAFFTTDEQLVDTDTDAYADVYERSGGVTTLISAGEVNGNVPIHALFNAASADGTRAFFTTAEQLVEDDTDASSDIYRRSGGTTTLISDGEINGDGGFVPFFARASADGTRVLFHTAEQLAPADGDSHQDIYERSGGTTTLISETDAPADTFLAGASTDGTRVFFNASESLADADTDSSTDVYERAGGTTTLVSAGGINGNGAPSAFFAAASADGSRAFITTNEPLAPADTDTSQDVYERSGGVTTLISAGEINGNEAFSALLGGISSDGTRAFFFTDERLVPADLDAGEAGIRDVYERVGGETRLVSVEMIPPETTIVAGPGARTRDRTPTFELGSSEEGSTFRCKLDSRSFKPCESPKTLPRLSFDRHKFRVRAIDAAGNEDRTPAKKRFRVVER